MDLKSLIPNFTQESKDVYNHVFTVFTPVFNAEKTIKRVHNALLAQTFKDFEWLIINDGSTDKSDEVITEIIANSPLSINYINNKQNRHKMACFMQGITLAKGEFFMTFDSDDSCVENALEILLDEYQSIPEKLKSKVSAVTGLCENQFGKIIGNKFPEDSYYSNTFKSYNLDGVKGEKWGFTKTAVLKGVQLNDHLFNKGLIPESTVWNLLSKEDYITKYINKVVRIYYVDMEDSLSSFGLEKSALGTSVNAISSINWFYKKYLFKTPMFFLKKIYILLKSMMYLNYNLNDVIKAVDSIIIKLAVIILWPFKRFL